MLISPFNSLHTLHLILGIRIFINTILKIDLQTRQCIKTLSTPIRLKGELKSKRFVLISDYKYLEDKSDLNGFQHNHKACPLGNLLKRMEDYFPSLIGLSLLNEQNFIPTLPKCV
ncbi:CLUMA_CG003499, isoform A [Clunio marinus]|uniref:CLUMA_CG003499, isoform A n=1 Tax=Clunio marinus TaxID=568069 RepID=A0A1J1HNZ7_9DIPT|nr:CLUMA_CG003499, isoform A [Clunio marinus]